MKRYVLFGFLVLLCVIVTAIYLTKPDEDDFAKWFQEKYNIQCEDKDCYVLSLNKNDNSRHNKFWCAEGYYDNSTGFLAMGMQTKRLYRNADDENQFFSIEVKGFLGNFEVLDKRQNKVDFFY